MAEWKFTFGEDKPEVSQSVNIPQLSFMTEDWWTNYTNDVIYEMDTLIRAWIEDRFDRKIWSKGSVKDVRRVFSKWVWEQVYGEPFVACNENNQNMKWFCRILDYYSSSSTPSHDTQSWQGKRVKGRIFWINTKGYHKLQPYSIRLRIEKLNEQGIKPDESNMKVPPFKKPGRPIKRVYE